MKTGISRPEVNDAHGFTLLELLISLTIVGVIVVIIFGSLRMGIRAWEKGERNVESQQRKRVVLDLVKHQMSSICMREVKGEDNSSFLFRGTGKSMEFVSLISLVPGNQLGEVYVKYTVVEAGKPEGDNGEAFRYYEANLLFLEGDKDPGNVEEDKYIDLVPVVYHIGFEYMGQGTEEDSSEWKEDWDPETEKGLPRAIRITFQEDSDKAPIHVIARIM